MAFEIDSWVDLDGGQRGRAHILGLDVQAGGLDKQVAEFRGQFWVLEVGFSDRYG